MTPRRRTAALLATGITAVATALAAGTPATATGWTITPAGTFTATAAPWTITDPRTAFQMSCRSQTLGGTLIPGVSPTLGHLSTAVATACAGTLGITVTMASEFMPWAVNGLGYNSATDTVSGTITGMKWHMNGTACQADLAGSTATSTATIVFTYANATHTLTLGSSTDLHVWNVSGVCGAVMTSGDAVALGGTYDVEPPQTIRPA